MYCAKPASPRRLSGCLAGSLCLLLSLCHSASAVTTTPELNGASEEVTELRTLERVKAALDRSIDYMTAKQRPDGGWS